MTYLITLAEVQERYDISGNMNSRRFNAAVVNMQEMGLRGLLGRDLYNRVIAEIEGENPSQAITDLVSEAVPYMSAKTVSFLFQNGGIVLGAFGNGKMQSDVLSNLDPDADKENAATADAQAETGAANLRDFIRDHIADYPEYRACETENQYGGRIWQLSAKYQANA